MGNGTKYATSTATSTLPSYLSNAYQNIVGNATQTANTPYTPYTGGFTQDQQSAFQNIAGMWGSSDPSFGSASTALSTSMVPTSDKVSQYMSPYIEGVVAPMIANMNETNAQQQQQVVGNAIAKGAMGGNRVGVAQSELARQQKLANNQQLAELYNQGYGQALGAAQADKTAALEAAGQYAGLGKTQMETGLQQAGAQLGAGTQQQQFDYQQYLNALAFPYQQQSWLASIAGGLAPSAGGTTTESTPQGNIFSQLLGTGLGVASLFRDGGRVHAASGGVMGSMPYANNNGAFPSYMQAAGLVPYANDNGAFGSYIPQVAIGGGGRGFPTISSREAPEDPVWSNSAAMKKGAGNIKSWLRGPTGGSVPSGFGDGVFATGGVVGRGHYAGGGNTAEDISASIFGRSGTDPKLEAAVRALAAERAAPTIDTVNAIDGDYLGLGWGNGTSAPATGGVAAETAYYPTPDDRGLNGPPAAPISMRASGSPDIGVGGVPFSGGDQFTTTPAPGYSTSIGEAFDSLREGNGLNLAPDMRQALLAAGAGMASSKSPFALAGIGEGVQKGIDVWGSRQALERENAAQRASNAKTGAEIIEAMERAGLTSAMSGRERQTTQIEQWEATRTPYGFILRDKTRGDDPGTLFKWGEVLPTGDVADPMVEFGGGSASTAPEPLFTTEAPTTGPDDTRLMVPEFVPGIAAQTQGALEQASTEMRAAQSSNQMLEEMRHQLDTLPENGFMVPGEGFDTRTQWARTYITGMSALGLRVDPQFAAEVGAAEDLNKLTTRLGFDLSQTLGSNEAASIVMQSMGAVPGGLNTPEGAKKILAGIEAANRRRIDRHKFMEDWARKHANSLLGAEQAFNSANPPELYALSAFVPEEDLRLLRENPDTADQFNEFYGNGRDVARYVIGR